MMKRLTATLVSGLIMLFVSAVPAAAAANPATNFAAPCRGGVAAFLMFRSWDACLARDARGVPQITALNDIWLIVLVIVEDIMKAAGYVAVGFIVWGGVKYTKSQGDPGELQQARQIIHNAVFGLVITIIAIAIVTFVTNTF